MLTFLYPTSGSRIRHPTMCYMPDRLDRHSSTDVSNGMGLIFKAIVSVFATGAWCTGVLLPRRCLGVRQKRGETLMFLCRSNLRGSTIAAEASKKNWLKIIVESLSSVACVQGQGPRSPACARYWRPIRLCTTASTFPLPAVVEPRTTPKTPTIRCFLAV